ncbi:hypothetical protein EAG18_00710 [Pseudoalteromonas sp. J010]|uniref:PilW family protein n=1 Tax=Pseudoalteromonas sp. J010 TaxID=998465 RepID=UPI000F64B571|nr:prepilin-type N-terminal cleavage/methylation domain-containing protein [Pseudoalteromonas sp. J010]RRS10580.1 hypothetical protein EAG18_00710 [Pseudoalteromonas sp. J010]
MVRSQLKRMQGLSLVELAVSMAVLSLLLAAILPVMTSGIGAGGKSEDSPTLSISESRLLLDEIDGAILGFLQTHHRLPCPDINLDGREDCTVPSGVTVNPTEHGVSGDNKVHVGYLPVADLQIALNADEEWRRVSIEYGVYRQQQDSKDLVIQGNHYSQVPVNHEPLCEEGKSDCAVKYHEVTSGGSLHGSYLGKDLDETSDSKGMKLAKAYTESVNNQNILDFCHQITSLARNRELSLSGGQRLYVKVSDSVSINPAYALSISRSQKVLTGKGYSERSQASPFEFFSSAKEASNKYDDISLIKTFAQLNRELTCGKRLSQANTSLYKGIAHIANENMYQLHMANTEIYLLNTAEAVARLELEGYFLLVNQALNLANIGVAVAEGVASKGSAIPAAAAAALATGDYALGVWYIDTNALEKAAARSTLESAVAHYEDLRDKSRYTGSVMKEELKKAREIESAGGIK